MKPSIRIVKFWTKYPMVDGKPVPVDFVEYCAPGMAQRSTTVARINEISKVRRNAEADDVAGQLALSRWEQIERAYVAWKAGQEMPAHGTPLAAWPGLSPEQSDVFRLFGFKSVEDIAEASASVLAKVQLPGTMDIQQNAQRFLAAKDQTKVADELAKKDGEISDLRGQLEELRQIVLAQERAPADDDDLLTDEKPRRGRPRKIAEPEVAA